jgi:ubiquitin-protein ligase
MQLLTEIFSISSSWVINVEGATGIQHCFNRLRPFVFHLIVLSIIGTLYEGEQYQLQFKFPAKYPFDSPQVRDIAPLTLLTF